MPDKHPKRGKSSDIIITWILGEPRAQSWKGRRCPLAPPLCSTCVTRSPTWNSKASRNIVIP